MTEITLPDDTTQSGTAYKNNIDFSIARIARVGLLFTPKEQDTPDMTVRLDDGAILDASTLTEVAAQSTGTITAPSGNPRIDRVVVDKTTGAVSVVTGSESGSPSAPAIPLGKFPVCQILLDNSPATTSITNSLITDERVSFLSSATSGLPRMYFSGLELSNGTDSDHDIDIAAGECRDNADAIDIVLAAAFGKQIDATWVAGGTPGTPLGGLSSSLTAPANDTWYHVHAIIVGGSADVGFDTSIVAANLIADHSATAFRYLGSVLTDGSANIEQFIQIGNEVLWVVVAEDNAATLTSTAVNLTLSVPPDILVNAKINAQIFRSALGAIRLYSPLQADVTATDANSNMTISASTGTRASIAAYIRTNTSSQIRVRANQSLTGFTQSTEGWVIDRGII